MSGVATVILVGRLGRDPEEKFLPSGVQVATFSIATSEKYTGQNGPVETTSWWNVTVFGKKAEACGQYLKKGKEVYVAGRLKTRTYQSNDGTTKVSLDVTAQEVTFLGGAQDGNGQEAAPLTQRPQTATTRKPKDEDFLIPGVDDGDVPF